MTKTKLKRLTVALTLGLGLSLGTAAHAAPISAFGWTTNTTAPFGNGSVAIDNVANTATLTGHTFDASFLGSITTSMETTSTNSGVLSFDWTFYSSPFTFDLFFWLNDGLSGSPDTSSTLTAITSGGSSQFLVGAGDTFGFSIVSVGALGILGQTAIAEISNFDFVSSGQPGGGTVPVPPTLLLFGAGLLGLGLMRKQKLG